MSLLMQKLRILKQSQGSSTLPGSPAGARLDLFKMKVCRLAKAMEQATPKVSTLK